MVKLEFRWASVTELSEFVPKPLDGLSKDLRTAFEDVYQAWDNEWGLAHWKAVTAAADGDDIYDTSPWFPAQMPASTPFQEANFDELEFDTRQAHHQAPKSTRQRISDGLDPTRHARDHGPKPSRDGILDDLDFSTRQAQDPVPRLSRGTLSLGNFYFGSRQAQSNVPEASREAPIFEEARRNAKKRQLPSSPIPHKKPCIILEVSSSDSEDSDEDVEKPDGSKVGLNPDGGRVGLNPDDLKNDSALVTIYVGPDDEEFIVPRESIKTRPYFRDVQALENEVWVIRRNFYRAIDPEKFKWIADFLSTGDFGHRIPTEDSERKELTDESKQDIFLECAEAYEVAKEVVMDDLIDLILEKLQSIKPWSPLVALSFATIIFQEPTDASCRSEAEENILKTFGNYLAKRFWYFNENHYTSWKERMTRYPGMAREVYTILAEKAHRKLQESQDEEGSENAGDSGGQEWSYELK